jgi:Kef-type K+ transport system membrane component KefB
MKRAVIAFFVSVLVLASVIMWLRMSPEGMSIHEVTQIGIIFLMVVFGLFFAWRRFSSVRRGEPVEDEMSKRVMQKASSLSYFISLYLWVFVIYINDRVDVDTEVLIGSGILGMSVIFVISWLIIYLRGLRNE